MSSLPISEWERRSANPESLNVGKLNTAVRELREELYQMTLRADRYYDKWQRLRVAVRALNRAMREKRYQAKSRRYSELIRVAEQLTWVAGPFIKATPDYTWFRVTKENFGLHSKLQTERYYDEKRRTCSCGGDPSAFCCIQVSLGGTK